MPEIVQKKSYGSVKVFWLNRDVLINELKESASLCAKTNKNVKKIILIGSVAKNRATPFSDVDIIIIVDKKYSNSLQCPAYYSNFFDNIPLDVEIFVYSEKEFKISPFYTIALREGKVLYPLD